MKRTKQNITSGASARKVKPQKPLTPDMALSMLESAVSYCQESGLQINAINHLDGTLGLFIPGAHYVLTGNGTRAAIRLGAFYPARDDKPTVSAQG